MPNGVVLKYKGETIASLENSGSLVINTSGNFCEDDILLEYTAPQMRIQVVSTFQMADLFANFQPTAVAEEYVE